MPRRQEEDVSIDIESSPFRRRRSTHLSRGVELAILGLLILIFVVVAVGRIWQWRIIAEQAGVMQMEGTIRTALSLVVMEKVAKGKTEELAKLDASNPMELLDPQTLPAAYLGVLAATEIEKVPGYRWYFDRAKRELIYVVGNSDYFETTPPGASRAAYRIKVQFKDLNGNGRFDGGPEQIAGVYFMPVTVFKWRQP